MFPENIKTEKVEREQKISALIYGGPMSGKTYMAQTFPNTLHFNTDGNTQDIDSPIVDLRIVKDCEYKVEKEVKKVPLSRWLLFKYYAKMLIEPEYIKELKEKGYETLTVDVLDHLFDWCRQYHLDRKGLQDESEDEYFKVLNEYKKDFKDTIVAFIEATSPHFNLVLVGFDSIEEYQDGAEKKSKVVPSLKSKMENSKGIDKFKVFEAITSRITVFGNVTKTLLKDAEGVEEEKRIFIAYSTKDYLCGNRFGIERPIWPTYESIKNSKQ